MPVISRVDVMAIVKLTCIHALYICRMDIGPNHTYIHAYIHALYMSYGYSA